MNKLTLILALVFSLGLNIIDTEALANNCKKENPCGDTCIAQDQVCHKLSMCSEYFTKTSPKEIEAALGVPVLDHAKDFEWSTKMNFFKTGPGGLEAVKKTPLPPGPVLLRGAKRKDPLFALKKSFYLAWKMISNNYYISCITKEF